MKPALKEVAKQPKKIALHPATASQILADLKVSRSEIRIGRAAVAKYIRAGGANGTTRSTVAGKKTVKSRKTEK